MAVEVVVVVIVDLVVVVMAAQIDFVVVDNENFDCNYYSDDGELDNESLVDVEIVAAEMIVVVHYVVALRDDVMMKMVELVMILVLST